MVRRLIVLLCVIAVALMMAVPAFAQGMGGAPYQGDNCGPWYEDGPYWYSSGKWWEWYRWCWSHQWGWYKTWDGWDGPY